MSRLVVVSNRLADPRKTAAGGLAVALADVLNNTGGMWFGWSGKVVEAESGGAPGEGEVHVHQAGPVKLVTVDLSREDHDAYYAGYSNGVLWPVFHYRLDLADYDAGYIAGILAGADPRQALEWGSALGASCVRAIGTTAGVFTRAEAEEFMRGNQLAVSEF